MRILYVTHGFPPHSSRGTELYAFYMLKELGKQHSVHVFYREQDRGRPEYEVNSGVHDGIPYTSVNNCFRNRKGYYPPYDNPAVQAAFSECLDAFRPDVVHMHHLVGLSVGLAEAAKARKIRVFFTLHDFWLMCPRGQMVRRDMSLCPKPEITHCLGCQIFSISPRREDTWVASLLKHGGAAVGFKPLGKRMLKLFYNFHSFWICRRNPSLTEPVRRREEAFRHMTEFVDYFIVPSQTVLEKYKLWGISSHKLIHGKNGYPKTLFKESKRLPASKVRFGYIGSLMPSKGIHLLVEAMNGLDPRATELHLFGSFALTDDFLGYEKYVRKKARHPHIFFHGEFIHTYVSRCFESIDVLVMPSLWYENAPLVIQEAMLAGVAVIAAAHGGMAEMVKDGVNGLLFMPGNAADLRLKMKRLADDQALRRRLEKAGKRQGEEQIQGIAENAAFLNGLYEQSLSNSAAAQMPSS